MYKDKQRLQKVFLQKWMALEHFTLNRIRNISIICLILCNYDVKWGTAMLILEKNRLIKIIPFYSNDQQKVKSA